MVRVRALVAASHPGPSLAIAGVDVAVFALGADALTSAHLTGASG
jgi:hypothetical protein